MARPKPYRAITQRAGRLLRRFSHSSSSTYDTAVDRHAEVMEIDDSSATGSSPGSPRDIASLISLDPSPLSSQTSLASQDSVGMCPPEKPRQVPLQPTPPHHQGQSMFFRRLPPEIREQIYTQYWLSAGMQRHIFLEDGNFCFAPCIADHDSPVDECQKGLEADFALLPSVQKHEKWFSRMTSGWCNHWRCEEAYRRANKRHRRKGGATAHAKKKLMTCLPLLLSCKRFYHESLPSMQRSTSLTVTDRATACALFIRGKAPGSPREAPRYAADQHPIFDFLPHIQTLNISLRQEGPDFLYLNGPSLWSMLSGPSFAGLARISLWLDGWEPVSRRLIPQFREIWSAIPPAVARKLTVSFPCAEDGMWAWEEVPRRIAGPYNPIPNPEPGTPTRVVELLPPLKPEFRVVLRGWEAFTANGHGWIMRNATARRGGPGQRRILSSTNPFEDLKLYGRGFFDSNYP